MSKSKYGDDSYFTNLRDKEVGLNTQSVQGYDSLSQYSNQFVISSHHACENSPTAEKIELSRSM